MNSAVKILSHQGYVPATCTLPDPPAFQLVMAEENAGRRACWGCEHDRAVCGGEPKQAADEPDDLLRRRRFPVNPGRHY